tara:strand:- start:419 stop:772 length:354 start_codon:yes stop_codon:yes gene_type:complete
MGRLTTHVLDTARGMPAANLLIDLYKLVDNSEQKIKSVLTNNDGRCDEPLLEGSSFASGKYKLVFHAASYLKATGELLPQTPFLDEVVINFGIDNSDQHYHVPLLLSAYGYSTYRGS